MIGPLLGVICFYLVIFFIGWRAGRNRGEESVSELLTAGRRIPLWIGVLTMTATWVDGGYLNGTAEAVYGRGIAWAQAPWGFGLSLALGGAFFARVMHQNGFQTMLDPFQQRYGERLGAVMYLPAATGELLWTSGILAALGTTFAVLLGVDVRLAILISAGMTVTYTSRGGLWSIAYTDVAQLIMACSGMLICVPFVFAHFGSLGEVWSAYQLKFPHTHTLLPDGFWGREVWGWGDSMLLLILGGIPWHCYFQRVLSSPTPRVAQRLSWAAAVLCILMALPPAALGMAGAVFDWQGHGMKPPQGDFLILPTVLRDLAPQWVGTLGLCAVAGAIMSSVDASIYSAASMFSWNIMHKIFRPEGSAADITRTNRRMVLLLGGVAIVIAVQVKSIYLLWFLSADLVYVLLFPQLLIVLYARKISREGVIAGLLVGAALRLGGGEAQLGIPSLIPYPAGPDGSSWFPFKSFAMVCGGLTTLVVSRLWGSRRDDVPWLHPAKAADAG